MTIYEPRETRHWSTRELDALIGKHVAVQINGAETEGVVEEASIGNRGIPFIAYRGNTSGVQWDRDYDKVTIAVHDGQDHATEAQP